MVQRAELELLRMIDEKPGDARLYNFLATFYRTIGAYPQAQEQGAIARSLSPNKQAIILEQGVTEVQMGNSEAARDFFKEAYELDTDNDQALVLYASMEAQLGDIETVKALLGDEHLDEFAANDFALNSVHQNGDREFLAELFEQRVKMSPENPQNWASLSFIYYEMGDTEKSIDALERAAEHAPKFATQAHCFIDNIKAGNDPSLGCTPEAEDNSGE